MTTGLELFFWGMLVALNLVGVVLAGLYVFSLLVMRRLEKMKALGAPDALASTRVPLPPPAEERLASWTVRIPRETVLRLERVARDEVGKFTVRHPGTPPGTVGITSIDSDSGVVWEVYPAGESPARPWLFVWSVMPSKEGSIHLRRSKSSFPESEFQD